MDKTYWGLFWATGMPEAWMLTRDRPGAARADAGLSVEGPWGLSGPPSGVEPLPPGGGSNGRGGLT